MGSEAKGSGLKTERIKAVNLARAVRISGDGGQQGRHLAKKQKGYGTRNEAKKAAEAYAVAQAEATRATVTLVFSRGLASSPAWSRKKVTVVQK